MVFDADPTVDDVRSKAVARMELTMEMLTNPKTGKNHFVYKARFNKTFLDIHGQYVDVGLLPVTLRSGTGTRNGLHIRAPRQMWDR